jgi:hypothetical protein
MAELTGLFQVRHPNLLVARSRRTLESIQQIADGRLVNGHIKTSRNPKFNALAHAVFARIAEGTGRSPEVVKMWLKAATGRADLIQLPNGQLALHGHPMDFASMGEQEFRAFWEEALVYIFTEILPGVPARVREEIERMVIRESQ